MISHIRIEISILESLFAPQNKIRSRLDFYQINKPWTQVIPAIDRRIQRKKKGGGFSLPLSHLWPTQPQPWSRGRGAPRAACPPTARAETAGPRWGDAAPLPCHWLRHRFASQFTHRPHTSISSCPLLAGKHQILTFAINPVLIFPATPGQERKTLMCSPVYTDRCVLQWLRGVCRGTAGHLQLETI